MATKTKKKHAAMPTERAEARVQEEARAHSRPVLTREAVGYILACVPAGSALVLKEIFKAVPARGRMFHGVIATSEDRALTNLLRALAEGAA